MENFASILSELFDGAPIGLVVAYIIVSILVVVMAIVALVMKILIAVRYWKANKMPISTGMTGADAARYVLDKDGLTHIKVKKAGVIRSEALLPPADPVSTTFPMDGRTMDLAMLLQYVRFVTLAGKPHGGTCYANEPFFDLVFGKR